jgi:ribosome-associated protein
MSDDIKIGRGLSIPSDELSFTFSTSSGPGGQHANRSATRADVAWNIETSRVLGGRQRALIKQRLRNRIDSSGNLRLSSDRYRSQTRNRRDVLERLGTMVSEALRPRKARVPTAPTGSSVRRRLSEKKRRGEIKRARRTTTDE